MPQDKPVGVRPLPLAVIMRDLADFLHREPPGPETLVATLGAGITAATRNGTVDGMALAALLAAIGETNSAIFGAIADRIDLATGDAAGSA